MSKLKEETYYGNIEYKIKFTNMDNNKINKYATQLKFRLIEGKGEAFYYIGVTDEGNILGIENTEIEYHINIMKKTANEVDSELIKIDILPVKNKDTKLLVIQIKANFDFDSIFLITD